MNRDNLYFALFASAVTDYKLIEDDPAHRVHLVATVEDQLAKHYRAVNAIGMGSADAYVRGGELFIRWVKMYGARLNR